MAVEDYKRHEGASKGTVSWERKCHFRVQTTQQSVKTHHADGILEGRDLSSSLLLISVGHENARGA